MKDEITSRGVTFRRPLQDEKTEQASIKNLVLQIGGEVGVLGTVRAVCCGVCGAPSTDPSTRQTPGLPDLVIYLPPVPQRNGSGWRMLWMEVKGRRGTLSQEQVAFRALNQRAGVDSLVGGLDEFVAYLAAGGWVRLGT